MKQVTAVVLLFGLTIGLTLADGKMFSPLGVPPGIPDQRALILYDQGMQTLILQSSYEMPAGEEVATLGWVVPVPAVPEVASLPADVAQHIFWYLSMQSRPKVTRISSIVFTSLLAAVAAVAALSSLALLLCLVSFLVPLPGMIVRNRSWLARYAVFGFGLLFLVAIIVPSLGTVRGMPRGVELIAEHRVGIYDVSVVRSDDSAALIGWLNEHEFRFGDKDVAAFDSYLSQGWCFVVAIINPPPDDGAGSIVAGGMAAPLVLRFPHPEPVYPVALTGTGGFETEILVYLAAPTKMSAHERLELTFAGAMPQHILKFLAAHSDPESFFDQTTGDFSFLSKFHGKLSAEEMKDDITFTPANDNEPLREHVVVW